MMIKNLGLPLYAFLMLVTFTTVSGHNWLQCAINGELRKTAFSRRSQSGRNVEWKISKVPSGCCFSIYPGRQSTAGVGLGPGKVQWQHAHCVKEYVVYPVLGQLGRLTSRYMSIREVRSRNKSCSRKERLRE